MTRSQNTKRALVFSVISLVLCLSLLLGTTFAWFTDSVSNSGNQIQAGTLSISMNNTTTPLFSSDNSFLWEPGRSQVADIKLENTGTLWLKYGLCFANVDIEDSSADITEVLDVYKVPKVTNVEESDLTSENYLGTMKSLMKSGQFETQTNVLAPDSYSGNDYSSSASFTLVIQMQKSAGNQYQGATVKFDIVAKATQYTAEMDGFNSNMYDEDASLDFMPVSNAEGLSAALEEGKTAYLTNDITLDGVLNAPGDVTIEGNGNAIKIPAGLDRVMNVNDLTEPATITLSNVDLQGPTTGTYTRGISLYNNVAPVTLIMDNCSVSANYYAINLASANKDAKIIIRNSEITGWCAFQTHSPDANVTFENCTLKGINDKSYNADGWNGFATIVVNGYTEGNPSETGADRCVLTFKNCRIEATQTTGNRQLLLSVRAMNTTVNVENCTFYIDGEQIPSTLEALEPNIGVSSMEIAESLTVNFS